MCECKAIKQAIENLTLNDDKTLAKIKAKVDQCSDCRAALAAQLRYLEQMRALHTPALSEVKKQRLLRQSNSTQGREQSSFWQGFLAASVLIMGMSALVYKFQPEPPALFVNQHSLATEVTLIIDVPNKMESAELFLELPDYVALAGYDEFDDLYWLIDLKAGENAIRLPLELAAGADLATPLTITAELDDGQQRRQFALEWQVVSA